MGRRKQPAKKPKIPQKRHTVPTVFDCLFCNSKSPITVKLDKKIAVGNLSCSACGQSFQSPIHHLSEAVDVYSDWVDACHAVAETAVKETQPSQPTSRNTGGRGVVVTTQTEAGTDACDEDDEEDED